MPGVVEDYIKGQAEQFQFGVGYGSMRLHLDNQLVGHLRGLRPNAVFERSLVHGLSIAASRDIKHNRLGADVLSHFPRQGDTVLLSPVHEAGMRRAIRDWSHENNVRLKQEVPTQRMGMGV